MSTDLAWCAGFIDGEGTFGVQRQDYKRKAILYVQAGQVDRRVLEKLMRCVGVGTIYGPYKPRREGHSPYNYWRVLGSEKVHLVYEMLEPWLSEVKKAQYVSAQKRVLEHKKTGIYGRGSGSKANSKSAEQVSIT